MKNFVVLLILLALGINAGCSSGIQTIDASNDEALKVSSHKIRDSLPEVKRTEFDEAIQLLASSQVNMKDLFSMDAANSKNIEGRVLSVLNGKTADQIIAEAMRIKVERTARERKQAMNEIKELEVKQQASNLALEELKKFVVLRSRFYKEESRYMGEMPVIELSVWNGTSIPVSRAYFVGTIASPNRSIPWLQKSFNYSIPGGLEPGETVEWVLSPNQLSDWGKVAVPSDVIFTVVVEKLDGPDGKELYSVQDFGVRESERLAELKGKYGLE